MAGATLSSSLPARFTVKMEDARSSLEVGIQVRHEKTSLPENDRNNFACPHCSFTSASLSELKAHRWEVHPLLAKRKGHLMSSSPKNFRKRPNSESSDDGKSLNSEDSAPKKKSSPQHYPLSPNELTPNCPSASRFERSISVDEVKRFNCNAVSTSSKGEEKKVESNHSLTKPVEFSNRFNLPEPSFPTYREPEYLSSRRSASRSPESDFVPSPPSPCNSEENCDLHTLAKAAFNASPIRQPYSANVFENQSISVSPSFPYHHHHPFAYVIGGDFRSAFSLPGHLINGYQLQGGLHPNEGRVPNSGNFHEAFFPNQVAPPFPNPSLSFIPSSTSGHISKGCIPASTVSVQIPTYVSNVDSAPKNASVPQSAPEQTKLSALSQVATNRLTSSSNSSSKAENERSNFLTGSLSSLASQQNAKSFNPNYLDRKWHDYSEECGVHFAKDNRENTINSQQRHHDKEKIMDDDRVRSLEEALKKIDCCDPQERSNSLPYCCPDGKWRMVQVKCVGGAWLIQIPGAERPSVYLPYQKASSNSGLLDNWLKARLTSSNPLVSCKNNKVSQTKGSLLKGQNRYFEKSVAPPVNPKECRSYIHVGSNQPVQGGAIKSLLLQNSSLS